MNNWMNKNSYMVYRPWFSHDYKPWINHQNNPLKESRILSLKANSTANLRKTEKSFPLGVGGGIKGPTGPIFKGDLTAIIRWTFFIMKITNLVKDDKSETSMKIIWKSIKLYENHMKILWIFNKIIWKSYESHWEYDPRFFFNRWLVS